MIELFIFACAKQQTVVSGAGRDIAVGDWISLQKPEIGKFVGFDMKRIGGCQWLSVVRYVLKNHIFDAMRAAASFQVNKRTEVARIAAHGNVSERYIFYVSVHPINGPDAAVQKHFYQSRRLVFRGKRRFVVRLNDRRQIVL